MRSSHTIPPWRVMVGILVVAVVAGCGGTKPAPAPVAQPQANVVAPQPVAKAASVPKPKAKPKATLDDPDWPTLDPSINPADLFALVPEGPTFDVVRDGDKPVSADAFEVVYPPKGVDSTQYIYNRRADEVLATPVPVVRPPVVTPERKTTISSRSGEGKKKGDKKLGAGKTGGGKAGGDRTAERKTSKIKAEEQAADSAESNEAPTIPAGFTPIISAGHSRVGLPARIRCDRDGSEMALVTGGAVVVGHDGGPANASPQITVVLDSFYMDVTEVTLEQYNRFREILKEEKGRNYVSEPENASSPPNFPVLGVTLLQATFYARWAGKELPTEAEWERAARGEAGFDHPWGNGRPIWKQAREPNEIGAVKSYRTDLSPFGIYDLAGNAREWCSDRYSATAFADAMRASPKQLRNWKGPRFAKPENYHVVKGNAPDWKAWYREGMNASKHHPAVSFRCVLRISEKKS